MDNQKKTKRKSTGCKRPKKNRGRLIVVSAPSGSGKSTIINWLLQEHPELNLSFSISCTLVLTMNQE